MLSERINKEWYFWKNKNAFALLWDIPEDAQIVELPHDAMQNETPHAESVNGGSTGFYDGDQYCYVKKIFVPEADKNKVDILKFEGVYMNAFIYVNEQFAGKCPNGYSTFYVPIRKYLKYGAWNEIRVLVKNGSMPNSRWYTGSGIYRDVYRMQGGLVHLQPDGVKVTTEAIEDEVAILYIESDICNESAENEKLLLNTQILDEKGNVAEMDYSRIELAGGETRHVCQRIAVKNAKLWSAETPNLYECRSILKKDAVTLDESRTEFGIRMIQVNGVTGLKVNGKEEKLRGACIHGDSGILGAATYETAEFRRIKLLKEAGFNAVRMSHNPMAPVTLRSCDKLGMYVMDELSDAWSRGKADFDYSIAFTEWWEKDVEAMVKKDYNHPSVVMYSVGNEIPEIGTMYGEEMCSKISGKFHELDKNRFTTIAINGFFGISQELIHVINDVEQKLMEEGNLGENVNHFLAKVDMYADEIGKHEIIGKCLERVDASVDIVGYNYMASRYKQDSKKKPQRVIVGSETYPPVIARNWKLVKELKNVIGDFTWTGWDYIGEAGIGVAGYQPGEGGIGAGYPCRLAYCGDLDITGFRRPLSYWREIIFEQTKKPYIAVQSPKHYGEKMIPSPWILSDCSARWNWEGQEGKPTVVEVYSAGDEVELYQNGKLLECKKAGEEAGYRVLFETTYEPGLLKAVSYENGEAIGETVLKTVGNGDHYQIEKEDLKLKELLYIGITYRDKDGEVSFEDQEIRIQVSGADVMGFGCADPTTLYSYKGNKTRTWNGRALLILKKHADDEPVIIKLEAEDGKKETQIIE